jgi:hypothetical protein
MAEYEWASVTLGVNEKITAVASVAEKASVLVGTNLTFVKTTLELGKILLLATLNPQLILLIAIADEIDNFVEDLKGTGFFILNVTPTGFEVNPRDQDGNRIKLSLGTETLKKSYADAAADGPETLAAFIEWSTRVIGVSNPPEGFVSSKYEIEQGKSEPDSIAAGAIATDLMVQKDAQFGFVKMTPSQIIATMIAAMDDPRDPDRPQLSDSADVAALIIIIGFSDLTKFMKPIHETIDLFMSFFGGEASVIMGAMKGIRDTVKQAQDFLDIPDDCQSTITVSDVCGVRGTEDDRETLKLILAGSGIWNEGANDGTQYYYNYADQFEEGDFVAGPTNILTGNPSLGYVREVLETTQDEEDAAENVPYVTQKLLINCMSGFDKDAFDSFSNGKILQKVQYVIKQETKIDNNTGLPIKQPERISFKYMKNLNNSEASAVAKVERPAGQYLLNIVSTESVIEEHGPSAQTGRGRFSTKNHVQGEVLRSNAIAPFAPPPNFQGYQLGELIKEMELLFKGIKRFTDGLRAFAAGALETIERLFKFLDDIIKELEELVKVIQAVLALFTQGMPDAGVFSLAIPSTSGGNNAIKDALQNSSNAPPNSLDFSVGFMMMGGAAAIDPLLTLLGV